MNSRSSLVALLCVILFTARPKARTLRTQCKSSAKYHFKRFNSRLEGAVIGTLTYETREGCERGCFFNPNCKSFNTHQDGLCQLNGKSLSDLTDQCTDTQPADNQNNDKCFLKNENKWTFISTDYTNKLIGENCEHADPCGDRYLCEDTCECPGYKCTHCNDITDFPCPGECPNKPCQNNGTCSFLNGRFTCTCIPGYLEDFCQRGVCDSSPCKNGGTCTPSGNTFSCNCQSGYTGAHCEKEINPCASNPCPGLHETCMRYGETYACN